MHSTIRNTAAVAIALIGMASVPALAEDARPYHDVPNAQLYNGVPNLLSYWDIQQKFGMVPQFFDLFPKAQLPPMWKAYKDVHLNPDTALDAGTKHLIGLAVAAEAECSACVYFHSSAAMANGASFQEIQEAVAIGAIVDDWSHYLTADTFQVVKQDTNALMSRGALVLRAPAIN
jgi:AhpD family alkylhydroperoxidase